MSTTVTTEWEVARKMQLDSDVRDLCDELDCLQERANRRLEEMEGEFADVPWLDDQKEMMVRLQKLVTTV